MDASEIHAWRLNSKEVTTHQKGKLFIFPDCRWKSKSIWRISGSENVLFDNGLERGEEREDLQGESDASPPPKLIAG